jgi:hypothetical protein
MEASCDEIFPALRRRPNVATLHAAIMALGCLALY